MMNAGTGMNLILTPLAADMLYEANIIEEHNPDGLAMPGRTPWCTRSYVLPLASPLPLAPHGRVSFMKRSIGRSLWYRSLLFAYSVVWVSSFILVGRRRGSVLDLMSMYEAEMALQRPHMDRGTRHVRNQSWSIRWDV